MCSEVKAAGFVIFRRIPDLEFLLLQASYRDQHWSPPKGHLEAGEDEITAAYRELYEESGIKKDQIKVMDEFKAELHYRVDGKPKTVHYWLAELIDKNFNVKISNEAIAYRWVTLEEACRLANFPDMQSLLQRAKDYILYNKK
ncbi:hypothetical protein O3M35_004470 [Rhynocoris fuscipes]|uniref:Bis(5'-nucleosyl)-tetraphosphatase [asymmetrical] n=1 Tax=Rhynocoris fuscipes TaxID=488301 RepID=A0AAW1CHS6_9HEMI